MLFLRMDWRGLWSVSTIVGRPYMYCSNFWVPKRMASISFWICAYCRSVGVRDVNVSVMVHPCCSRQAPSPFADASHCGSTSCVG